MKTSDVIDRASAYMMEHGHYVKGRNDHPNGRGRDSACCLVIAIYRSGNVALISWPLLSANSTLARYLVEAGKPRGMHTTKWSDTTPDEEFFLTLKRASEIARANGD